MIASETLRCASAVESCDTLFCDSYGATEMPESGVYEVSIPKSQRAPRVDSFGTEYATFFVDFAAL